MLKGHVFLGQTFENQIFALFANTFLNGQNGIFSNYKNEMAVTYNGNNVTVDSGVVCIKGRFLEEVTGTTISAGSDEAYCKLVIEVNLDNDNTEQEFKQGSYKIIKGTSSFPTLTQNDIVGNNAGIYQYEIARFKTGNSGITDFSDTRTFLKFDKVNADTALLNGNSSNNPSGQPSYKEIALPEGFDIENSIVVTAELQANSGWKKTDNIQYKDDNSIRIENEEPFDKVRILVMKL